MNLGRNVRVVGRYLIAGPIASGGMAVVHLGRFLGPEGFSRTVAVKQLHSQYAGDPEFVQMFLDEARLAARVRHPNVISPLDVVRLHGELFLVLEYVHGETLLQLSRLAGGPPPLRVTSAILSQTLLGLHAAHEAHDERGRALDIVHRDVSPTNVLVGEDGVARVLDFGIAKATYRAHRTREGQLKGKLGYMSPEQLRQEPLDRRSDVFAAGVVLWELVTGRALFGGDDPARIVQSILSFEPTAPSALEPSVPPALDAIALRALAPRPEDRFDSARDMAVALEAALPPASALEVGAWVERVAGASLRRRAGAVAELESVGPPERAEPASEPPLGVTRARSLSPAPFASPVPAVAPTLVDTPTASVAPAWTSTPAPVPTTQLLAPPARRPRRALVALTATAAVTVAATALALAALDPHARQTRANDAPAVAARPGAAQVDALRPATPPPPSSAPAPTAKAADDATPASTTKPALSPRPPRAVKKRVSCDVPFVIDEQGVKRFRPECFEEAPRTR